MRGGQDVFEVHLIDQETELTESTWLEFDLTRLACRTVFTVVGAPRFQYWLEIST